jgi:hypothetical protein
MSYWSTVQPPPDDLVRRVRRLSLSARERVTVELLLDRWPDPVDTRELVRTRWPNASPTERARRTGLMQLRRRLGAAGLALRCRAGIGYTLEPSRWPLVCLASTDHMSDSTEVPSVEGARAFRTLPTTAS